MAKTQQALALDTTKGLVVIDTENLLYCISEGNFTIYHTKAGEQYIAKHNTKHCYCHLREHGFIKINQRSVVNVAQILRYDKSKKILEIKNGELLLVSRQFEKEVISSWKII